jgi:hypothetical protein
MGLFILKPSCGSEADSAAEFATPSRTTMTPAQTLEIKQRLHPQIVALVERATAGRPEALMVDALLDSCLLLETQAQAGAAIVALEREVSCDTGRYHLAVRRLSTSVPVGKFQILISRNLASGLIV